MDAYDLLSYMLSPIKLNNNKVLVKKKKKKKKKI